MRKNQNIMNNEVMKISNVSLQYNEGTSGMKALSNIDLTIRKGDFVCALGPSGCGKSTLLNVMAGLLNPTSGTATMHGEIINGVDWKRAVVFQTPTLYPWMNTRANVAFGPKVRGLPQEQIDASVDDYLDLVGLSDFALHKPYELSGGMRQRAALARVLVNNPEIILMDEPFGALDAMTRGNMQNLVRQIWKETNNTVFLITHDVDEALTLGTRVVLMSSRPGQIIREFELGFTYQLNEGDEDTRYTNEYISLRKEILNIVHAQA